MEGAAQGTSKPERWQATPRGLSVTRRSARRSRFVGVMKFALPLGAALLLAVVVVWSGAANRNEGFRLSFASGQGEEAPEPGMVNVRYMGTDSQNRPFVITAQRADITPGDPDTIVLHVLQADMTLENGAWIALTAESGVYRRRLETLRLEGPVSLFSDTGFEFNAETAEVDLARGSVESDRPVSGQGPFGLLDAGGFRVVDEGRRLFFSGGVKLVVFPGAQR
jgi:lipopolysaccharide export system protein LptC